jgi:hypothetical protein
VSAALARVGAPAVAVGLAFVLLAGIVVAALRPGTASAATVLQRGEGVVAQLADGTSRPLTVGDEVPRGALVVAGRDGAVLRTRDRDTWLGGGSAVTVLDGARQELREGLVMVDARRGPGLLLTTAAAAVTVPDGAVSRVEGGPLLRVGAYDGDPLAVRPVSRRATTPVARDYQVQVPEGGLPGRVTPLVLTPGDAYERALAPMLVAADEALGDIAGRLDTGGEPAAVVRTAADSDVPLGAVPAGAPESERTLAYLLARAAEGPESLGARYATVRTLRGDGGSWGVVADLVQADVPQVAALLDTLLAPGQELLVADELDVPTLLGLVGVAPAAPGAAGGQPVAAPPGSSAPPPAGPGEPAPPPSDEPPPPPADVPGLVQTVVDTVIGLLPALPTTTSPSTDDTAPAPSPTSSPLDPVLDPLDPVVDPLLN